ncbi:MAG TPA: substrate-binding domain-containing protein [Abditibacteriaceae bacterium]
MKIVSGAALAGFVAFGVLALGGCSSPGANSSSTGNTASRDVTVPEPDAAMNPANAKQLRIAVIPKGLSHAFWQSVKRGAEDAGREMNAQIIWNGPQSEGQGVTQQVSIVEDQVTKKVDGIVLAPIDQTALVQAIDKAAGQKIPVAIIDSDAKTKNRISFVATDNYKGGVLAAQRMIEIIGGKGKVGMVPVQANSQSTEDRERGFTDTVKKAPGIKLVRSQYGQSDRTVSMNAAQDMLTANPDIVAIFGPNESSAVGSLSAVRNRNLIGKLKIVGFDSAPVLVQALKSGDIDSLVVQNPYKMGYEGVKAIVNKANGQSVQPRVDTGVVLVSKANMNTPDNQKLLQ